MLFDAETLQVVDDAVRRALKRPLRAVTMVARTSDITALVTEIGSDTMSVLVAGDLAAYEGDRVVMAQFGSDWVVLAGLTPRWPSELTYEYINAGETTTSGSFVDAPGVPAAADRTFTKRSALTAVEATVNATSFIVGAVPTKMQWAAQFTDLSTGVVYGPLIMADHHFSQATTRFPQAGWATFTGANQLPAGEFDAVIQWRRGSGTGIVTTSTTDDRWSFRVREIHPQ